ncbi:Rnase H [Vibrio phage EniLVp02]
MSITIYADGSSLGNPGPSGYGVVLRNEKTGVIAEYGRPIGAHKTNNQAELSAAIAALTICQRLGCTEPLILIDSTYVEGVIKNHRTGVKFRRNRPNVDLRLRLLSLVDAVNPTVKWVRGHSGVRLNEQADKIARFCARHQTKYIPGTGQI